MLGPAEHSLAVGDPALPGLALLLDDEQLSDWMSHQLGRRVDVRRRHLRYKPGTSCVLYADAAGVPFLVSAHRPSEPAKLAKTRERARAGAVLGAQPSLGVLLSTPAADRDLPALAELADQRRRRRLLESLLGVGEAAAFEQPPELLRYKPHRRWVGLLHAADGSSVLLRAYGRQSARAAADALSALQDGEPRTPRRLGVVRRHAVVAVEFLTGTPARLSGTDPGTVSYADAAAFADIGLALARLHRRPGVRLPTSPLGAEAAAVRAAAESLAVLLPDLAVPAAMLAERIVDALNSRERSLLPIHGDFSADQAIVGSHGQVALIDLDSAGLGDPAADLGSAAAAMARDVVLGELTEPARQGRLAALLGGYRDAGGQPELDRVAVHYAAHLLRRAVEPFRLGLTQQWPEAANDLLQWAESALSEPAIGSA